MRKLYTLLSLFMIFGCSSPESINQDLLNKRDGVFYTKDTNELYSGTVFSLYENGNKESEWTLKDGKLDKLYTLYHRVYNPSNLPSFNVHSDSIFPFSYKENTVLEYGSFVSLV